MKGKIIKVLFVLLMILALLPLKTEEVNASYTYDTEDYQVYSDTPDEYAMETKHFGRATGDVAVDWIMYPGDTLIIDRDSDLSNGIKIMGISSMTEISTFIDVDHSATSYVTGEVVNSSSTKYIYSSIKLSESADYALLVETNPYGGARLVDKSDTDENEAKWGAYEATFKKIPLYINLEYEYDDGVIFGKDNNPRRVLNPKEYQRFLVFKNRPYKEGNHFSYFDDTTHSFTSNYQIKASEAYPCSAITITQYNDEYIGTNPTYTLEARYENGDAMYATMTWHTNGGGFDVGYGAFENPIYEFDSTNKTTRAKDLDNLLATTPVKEGASFDGWYRDAEYTDGPYTNTSQITTGWTNTYKTFHMYAKWSETTTGDTIIKYMDIGNVWTELSPVFGTAFTTAFDRDGLLDSQMEFVDQWWKDTSTNKEIHINTNTLPIVNHKYEFGVKIKPKSGYVFDDKKFNEFIFGGNPVAASAYKKVLNADGSITLTWGYIVSSKPLDIKKAADLSITGISNKTYTGKAIKPIPTIKIGSITLKNGIDYTLSYKNNINVGTATVTITGKGKCSGTINKTFKINANTRITLNKTSATLGVKKVGKYTNTLQLKATVTGNNNKKVTWTSSNPKVAKVDSKGMVTAVSDPSNLVTTVTITAKTVDGKTAKCIVTVEDPISAFVRRLYSYCFDRKADKKGFDYWTKLLRNKEKTAAQAVQGFFESNEMKNKNLSNKEFLNRCYLVLMNRNADKGGLDYWLKEMKKGASKRKILQGFVESKEFTNICKDFNLVRGNIDNTK